MKRCIYALCAALILALSAHADDTRTYRKLTLENGLRVVLASDPSINVSSASMSVGIGANADPEGAAGLAHFLEHMLFLSTKKYPELNAYSNFLQARGGGSNAYTAADHTNYHFQVNHDALPEALDRFAQFFVSPTLDYTHAQREMMAVNSEHSKNMEDDTWRLMQLQRAHLRSDHPACSFSTGNKDTLAEVKEETLRGFFNAYYQAGNMSLAVVGKESLDALERLVRERFAEVPGNEAKAWTASDDTLEDAKGLRLLHAVPVKDMRELRIYFDIPNQRPHAMQKLGSLVGMTMGDEGDGSLLLHLKNLGLANFLSAGVQDTRYYSSCNVTVGLTPKGLEQWQTVLDLCFAYTRMLQTSEFPRHVWEEMRTLSTLQQRYSAKPEGTQAAIDLANQTLEYGLELAEKVPYTFEEPDPALYKQLVDALQPKNAMVFLVAKGLETDQQEQYYGTEFSFSLQEGEAFERLLKPEIPKDLHLPPPNPFVPKDVSLIPEQPVLLQSDAGVTLWYAQDTEFKRPKVALQLHVLSPAAYGSAKNAALTGLYAAVIQEQLNALSYPALVAGLQMSLSPTSQGLMLTVAGYSESAFKMLEIVSDALKQELDPEAFALVKERTVQGLKNFPLGQAYTVAQQLNRKLTHKLYVTPEDELAVVSAASLDDVKAHAKTLFANTHIESLCMGNLTGEQAKATVAKFREVLGSQPFSPEKAHEDEILTLTEPGDVVLKHVGATNNACLRLDYQVGAADVQTRMAASALARAVQNAFYTEMRTKQKLGYIVFSGGFNRKNVQNLVFIIQSGDHDAEDLFTRAEACITGFPELVAALPDEHFEAIRASLIEDRQKKAKSIAQKAGLFYLSAFEKEQDFAWLEREIEVLRELTKEQVLELAKATVAPESRKRVVVLINAQQQGEFKAPGNVSDWDAYRSSHTFSSAPEGR